MRKPGEKLSLKERRAQLDNDVRRLIGERKSLSAELAQLRNESQEIECKLIPLRTESAEREALPQRIAQAREDGRKHCPNFDAVVASIPLEQRIVEAILTSPNGHELLYALGLGSQVIQEARRIEAQTKADRERIEFYRSLHQQHFSGDKNANGQRA